MQGSWTRPSSRKGWNWRAKASTTDQDSRQRQGRARQGEVKGRSGPPCSLLQTLGSSQRRHLLLSRSLVETQPADQLGWRCLAVPRNPGMAWRQQTPCLGKVAEAQDTETERGQDGEGVHKEGGRRNFMERFRGLRHPLFSPLSCCYSGPQGSPRSERQRYVLWASLTSHR